jgi:glycosyltransferase involved in cell wall biosynthesis
MKVFVDHDNGMADATVEEISKTYEVIDNMDEADVIIAFKHPLVVKEYVLRDDQKLVYVCPIDAAPLDKNIAELKADVFVPMTEFGQKILEQAGIENISEPIPFSYDPEIFKPFTDEEMKEYVDEFALEECTVIGYSGPQDIRTNLLPLLFGFKELVDRETVKNPILMLNTPIESPQADFPLIPLAEYMGIGDSVMIVGGPGSSDIFNAMDVFVTTNRSDMFNIAAMRAMACGIPCVVTNYGGQVELVQDAGIMIPVEGFEEMNNGTGWAVVSKEGVANALDMALSQRAALSKKSVERSAMYTHEAVQSKWTKLLGEI